MPLPEKDHPIWKILQGVLALGGLYILAMHSWAGMEGTHTPGVDTGDIAGIGGTLVGVRLAWLHWMAKP